jgi:ABC-type Mn2+/Zn2+ transport system ATPase subunit
VSVRAELLVEAAGLSVGYAGRSVLEGVATTVAPGTSLALVGPNGSGKSTLLRSLVGLLPVVAGRLVVLGGAPGSSPRELAYLSQFHTGDFVLPLRARDVVAMARYDPRRLLRRTTASDREAVDEALARMGVAHLADEPLRRLSGGQRQRVYLAQILARRARLLVVDEPTAGLDAGGRELFLAAMQAELRRGAGLVTATHDIQEAAGCTRVMLVAGRLVAEGPPDEVLTAEHLLATFGVALARVDGFSMVTETHHGHDHDHGHA